MVRDILTPMNHREIEYNAKSLSGIKCPDSFDMEELSKVLEWLKETGNKVFDDDLVMDYGTDCLRLYLMFENTPKENDAPFYESWNEGALEGMYKFLGRYRRVVLVACECAGEVSAAISKDSVKRLEDAVNDTYAKINKYLHRGNSMPNRHNIISALMELLNLYQKELKIGEIVTLLHKHEIETPVINGEGGINEEIGELCNHLIGIMSPFAPDMSKVLFDKIFNKIG
jgi:leucyl-tRNA synthetase